MTILKLLRQECALISLGVLMCFAAGNIYAQDDQAMVDILEAIDASLSPA